MHNILQGVARPDERISLEEQKTITDWISENAQRYWFSKGGPLRPAKEGGADIVVVCESIYKTRKGLSSFENLLGPFLSHHMDI